MNRLTRIILSTFVLAVGIAGCQQQHASVVGRHPSHRAEAEVSPMPENRNGEPGPMKPV